MRFCYTGEDLEGRGEELLKPWRETFGEPVFDTFGVMPCTMMDMIGMDPVDPMGAYGHSEMLNDLSPETIETLVEVAGKDSNSPLIMLELRQLGGALSRPPADLNPMGRSDSKFILNGIGATFSPEMAQAVQAYLAYVAEAVKPHTSGAQYVNFMDLDGATPERVRAATHPTTGTAWSRSRTSTTRTTPSASTATSHLPRRRLRPSAERRRGGRAAFPSPKRRRSRTGGAPGLPSQERADRDGARLVERQGG